MKGKQFYVYYRELGIWQRVEVEVTGIPPEWALTPTLARIAARQALGVMSDVIVASSEDYGYHLHPSSETKMNNFWDQP